MMGCVLWKVLGWGYRDCVGMRGMRPRFYSSAFRALSGLRWYAGFPYGKPSTTSRADYACEPPAVGEILATSYRASCRYAGHHPTG